MLGDVFRQLARKAARRLQSDVAIPPTVTRRVPQEKEAPLKLDLGCGSKKKPGFLGIDRRNFDDVDGVTDLTKSTWIFEHPTLGGTHLIPAHSKERPGYVLPDNSVSEVHCSHFLEHLEHNQAKPERVRFMNELWRVLVPGGRATIITPHWASMTAFGDFTHADKPVSEMFYFYLDKQWRMTNAPDNDRQYHPDGYFCDFISSYAHGMHPDLAVKTPSEQQHAVSWYKEAALELHAVITARK